MSRDIYLDFAATTPLDPRVKDTMLMYMDDARFFGNPSSTHHYGCISKEAIEIARDKVASCIGADSSEIIWTSGATESNNLAIRGVWEAKGNKGNHIITSKLEHKSVLDVCLYLKSFYGAELTLITPERNGVIDPEKIRNEIRENTIMISIMHVNNEIGSIQDIKSIGHIAHNKNIIFHVDGAQAVGKIDVCLKELEVDLYSLSAHKAYGPKGIGSLYISKDKLPEFSISPQMLGGGQESYLRAGTLATHQIVGMGEAFSLAREYLKLERERIRELSLILQEGLLKISDVIIHGDLDKCVPNILNVSFKYIESKILLSNLGKLAISNGSACTSDKLGVSHVLQAIGLGRDLSRTAVRFSLGRTTSKSDIREAVEYLTTIVPKLRNGAPVGRFA